MNNSITTPRLVAGVPPLSANLPATDYFEIESAITGARYAVWVTTPINYDRQADQRYPAIYMPDGNIMSSLTAALSYGLSTDMIHPIQPFVQICVGYIGEEFEKSLAVRARDLLPPGEPLPKGFDDSLIDATVTSGLLDQAGAELYLHNLRNPAADKYLNFLTEELHPLVAERYRIEPSAAGLFGYSYGGLFALYAALRRSPLFRRIGAGSPGILAGISRIFEMYRDEHEAGADHSGRMLHVTVCEPELTVPSIYQPMVAQGTMEFIALAGQQPLNGLALSSLIIPNESHATGILSSYASYLRRCFPLAADR